MRRRSSVVALFVLLLAALSAGCILQFDSGMFQTFELHFTLSESLPEGRSTLVQSIHYPLPVTVRGRWIRLAGVLMAPDGGELPGRVAVASRFEDAETSALAFQLKKTARVQAGGSFKIQQKVKKDVAADTLQLVSVEPLGAALAEGTKLWLCIDLVRTRRDLRSLPECNAGGGGGGGGGGSGRLVAIDVRDNNFEPKRVRIEPGDTVRWTLTGANLNHTVTAMDESVFDSGFLTSPGAFFEITFDESHRDQTFQYLCRTHQSCCEMQGSIQVGANAPDPGDGY